jgi:hypothetical protein
MDVQFGTWKVRSLYRAGSLMTVVKEISKYKLVLQEYRTSDRTGVVPNKQVNIYFSMERKIRIMN